MVFRVTSRDANVPPAMPEHCTLTYRQRVLRRGVGAAGAYVDLEVTTVLPPAIGTEAPYPVRPGSLPDSVLPFLERRGTGGARTAVGQLLDRILEASPPVYQDQVAEAILGWAACHVEYDSAAAIDQSAEAVIERRSATCAGFAELAVALLRRAGIPARRMGCVIPPDCGWGQLGRGGRHAYIEAYYPDVGWLPSDPLRSFHFVDPFHLLTRIDGQGVSLGYETLSFELREDESAMQLAVLTREADRVRWSASMREAAPDTCRWVPYAFRHRRPDGFFVSVTALGSLVLSARDGSREFRFIDGTHVIQAATGGELVRFPNGDRKQTDADGTIRYFFSNGDRQTTYPDGGQLYEWANGERQARAPNRDLSVVTPASRQ